MTIAVKAMAALVWPGELAFSVTSKSGDGHDHRWSDLRLIRWQIAAGIASLAAVSWAIAGYVTGAA